MLDQSGSATLEGRARALAIEGVCDHPVFARLTSVAAVRVFMEHHVWAVWDFMSLLKSIQADVAPVTVPWRPPPDAESARLINEIVVLEEGDDGPDGRPISHFEAYRQAMEQAGADTSAITRFVGSIQLGSSVTAAIGDSSAPTAAKAFVRTTFELIAQPLHCRVAAFTLGRERVIPSFFPSIVTAIASASQSGVERVDLSGFAWYLERHVTVDGDRHGPMATRLFERTCLGDERTRAESYAAACRALDARVALWDAVFRQVDYL